ncbi:MAG: rubrerythrin family protein [Acidobacteria bacterium]|nr:rubrerythrin family protein [Acidobacteriota bacterium]
MDTLRDAYYQAYVGEAKAALRLKVFAEVADKEGYPQIARLFRVIALSEEIHGGRMLRLLQKPPSTEENLQASFESETRVAGVAYEDFIKLAHETGDDIAVRIFTHSRDVEAGHARLYKAAMGHLLAERETRYHVCRICGYVEDSTLPDRCPVCGVPADKFVEY